MVRSWFSSGRLPGGISEWRSHKKASESSGGRRSRRQGLQEMQADASSLLRAEDRRSRFFDGETVHDGGLSEDDLEENQFPASRS